jgi:putative thioredoxin
MTAIVSAVSEPTFARDVLDASTIQPVVVDFWAPWCGPCRQLSPMLEEAAQRYGDDVKVVKLNVDEAPRLAQQFRVQGIPAVKAFRDRRVVNEFVGLQPAAAIEQFFAALAPSAADRLVARAAAEPHQAEALLTEALEHEPGHTGALIALAGLATVADQSPEARLDYARALVAAGRHEDAVEELLAAVAQPATRDEARTLLLDVFRVLGDQHEITRRARPRLASALFA